MCASLLLSQALPAPSHLSYACARSDSKSTSPPRPHSASAREENPASHTTRRCRPGVTVPVAALPGAYAGPG